jgi:hypothetical protein
MTEAEKPLAMPTIDLTDDEYAYEGVNKTDRILGVHVIVDRLRQRQKLVARESRNLSHTRF